MDPIRTNSEASKPSSSVSRAESPEAIQAPQDTYDGPVFIAGVDRTLTNPNYRGNLYVGAREMLQGVAALGIPIVYAAATDAARKALVDLPSGTVFPSAREAVQDVQHRFPQAKIFGLGNDGGDDASLYPYAWIRNVRGDQSHVPPDFKGVVRDVYSPELIRQVLDTLQAARDAHPATDAGPNPPPIPTPSRLHRMEHLVGSEVKKVGDAAKILGEELEDHLRGGLDPVKFASTHSDDALAALSADALGVLGSRILKHAGHDRASASDQFMRVVTAHGTEAGHVEAILFKMAAPESLLDPVSNKQLQSIRQKDHPPVPGDWAGFDKFIDAATGTTSRPGTKVEPLIDGQTAFPAIMDAIEHARSSVNVTVYAFHSDETGWEVARRMAAAADRGCQVRLLYDVTGSSHSNQMPTDPAIYDFLRAHGVEVIARPDGPLDNERTHRKIIVVDGTVGFLGGMNVGDAYRNEWHDVHARVTGPAVEDLQRLFVRQWETEGGHIDAARQASLFPPQAPQAGTGTARIIGHDGRNDLNIKLAYVRAIDTAQHRINIADPYFADRDVLEHLEAAARRGVEVKLVFPLQNNIRLMQEWERMEYPGMLESGIHIWEYYGREMAHDKVATFDDRLATIGSSNLDQESVFANYEANVWTDDPSVIQKLATDLFAHDFTESHAITDYHPGTLEKIRGKILKRLEKTWL